MLERSPSRLTHLSMHFIPLTSNELLRLFLCVPLVTTLEVEEPKEKYTSESDVSLVLKSLVASCSSDCMEDHGGEAEVDMDNDEEAPTNGQCLLPCLKDLRLVIRPCTTILLELVRSRWRPSLLIAESSSGIGDNIANEVCVCLQKISIRCLGEDGEGMLEDLQERLKEFKQDGMSVEVSLS
ncbi:hypothetical protein BT96DRAFT_619497 [Gymnopus androsaceus JB14]|uniref:Uncharacterized protein n=1 Tax=Gymnopus androsaceus JB14 TaxID=1447944 RepID=A0A6A4HS28_9AGAR|nr:hypothetical protein BT96DRAFT_619497 [Gymnopus androsaceus JB14]